MGYLWRAFAATVDSLRHILDPFSEELCRPYEYTPGRWLWFIRERNNRGMTESEARHAFHIALSWAHQNGLKTVITTGIADSGDRNDNNAIQKSNDRRARFFLELASDYECSLGVAISLISVDNVYTRNAP